MSSYHNHSGTAINTASGTLLTIFVNIHSDDLVKTAVLAFIGAVVSFTVSLALKWISRWWKSK